MREHAETIEAFIVAWLATELVPPVGDVDPSRSLLELGLDSIDAAKLVGDLVAQLSEHRKILGLFVQIVDQATEKLAPDARRQRKIGSEGQSVRTPEIFQMGLALEPEIIGPRKPGQTRIAVRGKPQFLAQGRTGKVGG